MRVLWILTAIQALLFSAFATSDGLTDLVTWDKYSLLVNGERIFIFSGEFHYQRLPVPELWLDIFQKFKANGMNAISIYFFWSYHSPSKGVYDFETPGKDIQQVLDYAKQAGLYVLARPGPYCNAETNGGGYALWTSDGSGGSYRTSDETYHQAWLPWVQEVSAVLAKNQITNGGPVILLQVENELQETVHSSSNTLVIYMEQLKKAFRESGIVVPFFHNEKGMRSMSWSTDYQDVGGSVNIYGLDSYPGGLDCGNPDKGFTLVRTYYQWFQNYSFTQPEFSPEFAGGNFSPWGDQHFYDDCVSYHSPEYADVFYKSLIGQRLTLINLYMAYGGTNWGHSAAPVVYTSYDYSAPLRETREIQKKFQGTKLVALFARASTDLLETVMESNGTGNAVNNTAIFTWVLRNPTSGARFYLAEHDKSSSRSRDYFTLTANSSLGTIAISSLDLNGRQSRFIVTDYTIGRSTLLYSSAQVLTYGTFGSSTAVVFYLKQGQVGEFAFKSTQKVTHTSYGAESGFAESPISGNSTRTKYSYTQPAGFSVVQLSNGVTAYFLDEETAYTFFAPATTSNPNVKADQQIFVIGPYLVRTASKKGDTVFVTGDSANSTVIEVHAGDSHISTISWNGKRLKTTKTAYGSLTASIAGPETREISLPVLTKWKVADSLPEKSPSYNDNKWKVCDKNTTLSPVKPTTLPVLFSSDYGFYSGIKLYRAYFDGKTASGVNLTVQGGRAAGFSAWLNGQLVGYTLGDPASSSTSATLEFSNVTLQGKGNVLTVVTDYTGHDETSTGPAGAENPRGILSATLLSSTTNGTAPTFATWKIQGNAGGSSNIDSIRGPMNEGGLYGERLGWHLPGFDSSRWKSGSPLDGLPKSGINWYSTTFELDIPEDLDVPIGVEFSASNGTVARVQMFINGYQYAKYVPHIGPQTRFPIPPGILNLNGANYISLSLWAQTDNGAKLADVKLFAYGKYTSSFGFSRINGKQLQPRWSRSRLQYT